MKYLVVHNYYEYHAQAIVKANSEDEAIKIFFEKLLDYCEKNNDEGNCYLFCCPDREDYNSIEELVEDYTCSYPIQAIPITHDTGLFVYNKGYNSLKMVGLN